MNHWNRRKFMQAAGGLLAQTGRAAPSKSILEYVRAAEKLQDVDIVDAHAHTAPTADGAIWPQGPDALIEDMDRCAAGQAVFSHLGAIEATEPEEYLAGLDFSARAVRKYPSRLRSYLVFHPHLFDISMQQMKRLLEPDSPFVGFKLHGAFHKYPADGPKYTPVYEFANRHRLPVLFHVGGIGHDWEAVRGIAATWPGMSLILAHFGPGEEALPALLRGRSNLFIDTCISTGRYRLIERLAASIGAEKLLFATDATFDSVVAHFAKIAFADLPDSEKKLILGGNARRIFGSRLPPPVAG